MSCTQLSHCFRRFFKEENAMRSSGIVRKVDNLGRIVIPIEIRRAMSIDVKDPIEISIDGDTIVLRRQQTACALCGSNSDMRRIGDKYICAQCAQLIRSEFAQANPSGI